MESFVVDTNEAFQDVLSCLQDGAPFKHLKDNVYKIGDNSLEFTKEYQDQLDMHDIIYGINKESNIVNISVDEPAGLVYIFKEIDGVVSYTTKQYKHWVLFQEPINNTLKTLSGSQPYKYIKEYTLDELAAVRKRLYYYKNYTVYNKPENFMIRNGYTYFKDMKNADVSLLSFDIETTGLDPNTCELLLITNTFRKNGKYISKTFSLIDYVDEVPMISTWCAWVKEMDPTILLGHNINMFDIPFINTRWYRGTDTMLPLGRLENRIIIEERPREFRKDGSQTYTYHRINCFGREIVDTFFLSIKADIARKYESYGLKSIIKQEGLEEAGREFYDASQIGKNWHIPEERTKIIAYAEADSRDPIKLFDLMGASFFYICPVVPKTFQVMIESATGSQINAVLVRSYLQKDKSVAETSSVPPFQGAISFGVPNIYRNMVKIDFSALYPSIMRQYNVYDEKKDPGQHFLKIVEYFAEYRQQYKKQYKETKDKYYDDLQNVAKVIANSCYGFLAANGLNYNSPAKASFITEKARELLIFSITWATSKDLDYWIKLFEEKTK